MVRSSLKRLAACRRWRSWRSPPPRAAATTPATAERRQRRQRRQRSNGRRDPARRDDLAALGGQRPAQPRGRPSTPRASSYDIQNAQGDVAKFGTLCDQMINEGVKVLMIVNLDSESGKALPEEGDRRRHPEHRLRPAHPRVAARRTTCRSTTWRSAADGHRPDRVPRRRPARPRPTSSTSTATPPTTTPPCSSSGYEAALKHEDRLGRLQARRRPERRVGRHQGRRRVRADVHRQRRQDRRRRLGQRHHGRRHHRPPQGATASPARSRSPARTPASRACRTSCSATSADGLQEHRPRGRRCLEAGDRPDQG